MKLKKFTAVSLTVAMAATTLFGCGAKEEDAKDSSKDSGKKTSTESTADSFADAFSKSSDYENCDYEVNLNVSFNGESLFEDMDSETEELLDTLGISTDKIELKLGFDGSMKGKDAQSMNISYSVGNLSGDLTDYVYVDGDLYLNVAKAVDAVEKVADKLGYADEIETYTAIIPEGDYLMVDSDVLSSAYDAIMESAATESGVDLEDIDTDAITESVAFLLGEVEKAAKDADDAYSDKDGYTITVNNDNAVSFVMAFVDVFKDDADEIVKNIETIVGDTGIDIDEMMEEIENSDEDELADMQEELEDEIDGLGGDFNISVSTNATDDEWTVGYAFDVDVDGVKAAVSLDAKMTKNDDVKISAPKSVMSEEDVDSLLSMMGLGSMDDLSDMITSGASSLEDDYSYDYDYDYDYDDESSYSDDVDSLYVQ